MNEQDKLQRALAKAVQLSYEHPEAEWPALYKQWFTAGLAKVLAGGTAPAFTMAAATGLLLERDANND